MQNNDEKGYTLHLTDRQFNYLRHIWIGIDHEFIEDSDSESWKQWSSDMKESMRQAEIEHNQKTGE